MKKEIVLFLLIVAALGCTETGDPNLKKNSADISSIQTPFGAMDAAIAYDIAKAGVCAREGDILVEGAYYNENTRTWWFDIDMEKPGCAPACVIHEDQKTEINYRCTGLN